MLGTLDPQLSFVSAILPPDLVPEDCIHCRIAKTVREVISYEDFKNAYCLNNGRGSIDPIVMTIALILGFHENLSDRQIAKATRYDLRWKVALGLPVEHKGICYSDFHNFRTRLLENGLDREIFNRCVEACRKAGLLKDTVLQVIDSSLIEGAAATQDTITLIRCGLRKLMRKAKEKDKALEGRVRGVLSRKDYDEYGKPEIDWDNPEERRELLEELVRDAEKAVKVVQESGCKDKEVLECAELLDKVSHQDIEEVNGWIELKNGVAKDRIISVNDPEMRHGHKSSKGRVDGYKVHVVVEPNSEVISDIEVDYANGTDAEEVPGAIDRLEEKGIKPEELVGDCAYGSGDARAEAKEKGVSIVSKVPRATNSKGKFSKDDFVIDLEGNKVTCPGGQTTGRHLIRKDRKNRPVKVFIFPEEACGTCPLREQCISKGNRCRTITLNYHEGILQDAKRYQETKEFKEKYSKRPIAERVIADLKRHGGAKSRYIGKVKTRLQELLVATAHNVKKLAGWLFEKRAEASVRGEYAHMMV